MTTPARRGLGGASGTSPYSGVRSASMLMFLVSQMLLGPLKSPNNAWVRTALPKCWFHRTPSQRHSPVQHQAHTYCIGRLAKRLGQRGGVLELERPLG